VNFLQKLWALRGKRTAMWDSWQLLGVTQPILQITVLWKLRYIILLDWTHIYYILVQLSRVGCVGALGCAYTCMSECACICVCVRVWTWARDLQTPLVACAL
jgi:hypothetical protein